MFSNVDSASEVASATASTPDAYGLVARDHRAVASAMHVPTAAGYSQPAAAATKPEAAWVVQNETATTHSPATSVGRTNAPSFSCARHATSATAAMAPSTTSMKPRVLGEPDTDASSDGTRGCVKKGQ